MEAEPPSRTKCTLQCGISDPYPEISHIQDSKTYGCFRTWDDKELVSPAWGDPSNAFFICQFRSLASPVTSMDVTDWLEKNRYVSSYVGEWIVVSGEATAGKAEASAHKLEFHGKQREDAMEIIELMYKSTTELWTIGIKIPHKVGMKPSE